MRNTKIYKTDFQARKAAKAYFANIFNAKNVAVTTNNYDNSRYGGMGVQCNCGQTTCSFYSPTFVGAKRRNQLESQGLSEHATICFGICDSCGDKF